jgi:hypothetical protein
MIWLALMVSASLAAIAGLADSGVAHWLLKGSIAFAAGSLIGIFARRRGRQCGAIGRPTAARPIRRETGATQIPAQSEAQ